MTTPHSLDPARHPAGIHFTRFWIAALLGIVMLLLWPGSGMAGGRVQEFLPKAQPADFFRGADRFGAPQGDPPLVPVHQGDRLLGYVSEEINWARRRRAPLWPRRCRELLAELAYPGA